MMILTSIATISGSSINFRFSKDFILLSLIVLILISCILTTATEASSRDEQDDDIPRRSWNRRNKDNEDFEKQFKLQWNQFKEHVSDFAKTAKSKFSSLFNFKGFNFHKKINPGDKPDQYCSEVRRTDAASILRKRLKRDFFGQHIATDTVVNALDAHLHGSPGKALVMSFHGPAGSGKSYLTELIIEALYKNGFGSKQVKFYHGTIDFPDETKVKTYQDILQNDIKELSSSSCQYPIFIFDETHSIPPGVFRAIVPYLSHPSSAASSNYKSAIFIFISTTAAEEIAELTLENYENGEKPREELSYLDFQETITRVAFSNPKNGLFKSHILDRYFLDHAVPFLPLERNHVLQCIEAEIRRQGVKNNVFGYMEIADRLPYWPSDSKLYSKSGCRSIEQAVKFRMKKEEYEMKRAELGEEGEEVDVEDNRRLFDELSEEDYYTGKQEKRIKTEL